MIPSEYRRGILAAVTAFLVVGAAPASAAHVKPDTKAVAACHQLKGWKSGAGAYNEALDEALIYAAQQDADASYNSALSSQLDKLASATTSLVEAGRGLANWTKDIAIVARSCLNLAANGGLP